MVRISNPLDPYQTRLNVRLEWKRLSAAEIMIRASNSLDQDQARQYAGPDLDPNCLQKLNVTSISNSLDPDKTKQHVGHDLNPNCMQRLSADECYQSKKVWIKIRPDNMSNFPVIWLLYMHRYSLHVLIDSYDSYGPTTALD